MVAKKKPNKKQTGSKRTAGRKMPTKKPAKKSAILKKKPAKKKPSQRRPVVKIKAAGKTTMAAKTVSGPKRRVREQSQLLDREAFSPGRPRARSGGQSGELQGLSGAESVNSESVDELLEEGNAFEADIVTGVEEAGNTDEKEVHTHEVPEDDVPSEYLDKD